MAKRTIENCEIAKCKIKSGSGVPIVLTLANGAHMCQGYQRSGDNDEPIDECAVCPLCVLYDEESMYVLRKGMGC